MIGTNAHVLRVRSRTFNKHIQGLIVHNARTDCDRQRRALWNNHIMIYSPLKDLRTTPPPPNPPGLFRFPQTPLSSMLCKRHGKHWGRAYTFHYTATSLKRVKIRKPEIGKAKMSITEKTTSITEMHVFTNRQMDTEREAAKTFICDVHSVSHHN